MKKPPPTTPADLSEPDESPEEFQLRVTKTLLQPETQASIASCIAAVREGEVKFEPQTLTEELKVITRAVASGDMTQLERIATSQAVALNLMFTRLTAEAFQNMHRPEFEGLMRLAFRAQAQCARTLETLATIKNPAIFTKQLNVANQQVVNNALPPAQAPSPPAALAESAPIVRLADSEILPHAHERMD